MMLWIFRSGWWCRLFHHDIHESMIHGERWLVCSDCGTGINLEA